MKVIAETQRTFYISIEVKGIKKNEVSLDFDLCTNVFFHEFIIYDFFHKIYLDFFSYEG